MNFRLTSVMGELAQDMSDNISKIVADYADVATVYSVDEESCIDGHISFEKFKDMVKTLQDAGYGSYPMGGEQYPILLNVNEDDILCVTVYDSYIE